MIAATGVSIEQPATAAELKCTSDGSFQPIGQASKSGSSATAQLGSLTRQSQLAPGSAERIQTHSAPSADIDTLHHLLTDSTASHLAVPPSKRLLRLYKNAWLTVSNVADSYKELTCNHVTSL